MLLSEDVFANSPADIHPRSQRQRLFATDITDHQWKGDGGPIVLVATPDTILTALKQPSASHLFSDIQCLAIDEPDALLRGLPDRRYLSSAQLSRHPFFRHPPKGYHALEALFSAFRQNADAIEQRCSDGPRTLWISATLTSQLRGFVRQKGWIPRGADVCDFTATQRSSASTSSRQITDPAQSNDIVLPTTAHHVLLLEPPSGRIVDDLSWREDTTIPHNANHAPESESLNESAYAAAVFELLQSQPSITDSPIALIPTYSMSEARLKQALKAYPLHIETSLPEALHWQSNPPPTKATPQILVLRRSEVRGLDLPSSFRTVILLGGLCVGDVSPTQRRAGGLAEREREYRHFAGRVGRLDAAVSGQADKRPSRIITLVGQGSEDEAGMRRMFSRQGLRCEPMSRVAIGRSMELEQTGSQ